MKFIKTKINNKVKKIISIGTIAMVISTITFGSNISLASQGMPSKPGGNMGGPNNGGNQGSSSISYSGASTISEDTTNSDEQYESTTGGQNALLVSSGNSTLTNVNVNKTGDSSDENADFYGTNAGILTYNGATLNINNGTIQTNGSHANGVFAYGTGTINISDTKINTSSNNSGGIMVAGGGTINASNLSVSTSGNSSAAIRSDRGGGTIVVNGGTYETSGVGSPAVYSTANITVNNSNLSSTASEGIVVEGANSVTLNNTTLTDNNTTLNGNSETYKNIFLYQSMSGDASSGNASFNAKKSTITTNNGDTFFVTNTTATITLEDNTIINNANGAFIRIQSGKWGNSGSNGGDVTLNLVNQDANGNIYVDNISTLNMSLTNGSNYEGAINTENTAKTLNVTLDSTSTLTLTADSYITSLTDELDDYSNINLNGYTLYVNGNAITSTNYDSTIKEKNSNTTSSNTLMEVAQTNNTSAEDTEASSNSSNSEKNTLSKTEMIAIYIIVISIILLVILIFIKFNKHNKKNINNNNNNYQK